MAWKKIVSCYKYSSLMPTALLHGVWVQYSSRPVFHRKLDRWYYKRVLEATEGLFFRADSFFKFCNYQSIIFAAVSSARIFATTRFQAANFPRCFSISKKFTRQNVLRWRVRKRLFTLGFKNKRRMDSTGQNSCYERNIVCEEKGCCPKILRHHFVVPGVW